MTLYINGNSVGEITEYSETISSYVAQPETPGDTPIPAYKTGRGHDIVEMTVLPTSKATFFSLKATIKGYVDDEDVLYFSDTVYNLYDGASGFWGVIQSFESSLNAKNIGSFDLEIIVTTDHTDSSYTPS
jgi:hypothetical protein